MVVSPMCMYSSEDGFANDFHLVHLGSRAVGGSALIIQEATAVSPEGRITHGDMGLWKDEHIEKSKQIVDFVHSQNALIGIQFAHAGRKASYQLPKDGARKIAPEVKTVGKRFLLLHCLFAKVNQLQLLWMLQELKK